MRTFGKWLGRILLMLILAAVAVGLWKREELQRVYFVTTVFDEGKIVRVSEISGNALFASIAAIEIRR